MSGSDEAPGRQREEHPAPAAATPAAPAPADPAGFRLRGETPRVMRLSRKVIAGIGAVGALAVGGALTFALQSRDAKPPAELYNTDNRAVTERVTSGPRDNAALPPGVPTLGAPLPGDLGGPTVSDPQRGEKVTDRWEEGRGGKRGGRNG